MSNRKIVTTDSTGRPLVLTGKNIRSIGHDGPGSNFLVYDDDGQPIGIGVPNDVPVAAGEASPDIQP